jgi:hypothetical protein
VPKPSDGVSPVPPVPPPDIPQAPGGPGPGETASGR